MRCQYIGDIVVPGATTLEIMLLDIKCMDSMTILYPYNSDSRVAIN